MENKINSAFVFWMNYLIPYQYFKPINILICFIIFYFLE